MTAAKRDNRIESLQPRLQGLCRCWLARCRVELGIDVRIIETKRSVARQVSLEKSGLSSVKLGWHNVGLAWDFLIFIPDKDGQMDADGSKVLDVVADGADPRYALCGAEAAKLGCKYPIHLRDGTPDYDHIEYHPDFTLQQFLATPQGIAALKET